MLYILCKTCDKVIDPPKGSSASVAQMLVTALQAHELKCALGSMFDIIEGEQVAIYTVPEVQQAIDNGDIARIGDSLKAKEELH